MIKTKETKEILREWHSFEQQNMINENQSSSQPQRKKIEPSEAAKKAKKELEDVFGKGRFWCYDNFDKQGFSDDEMINLEYGHQIEIEGLTKHIKNMPGFPKNVDVTDIVLGTDEGYDIALDTSAGKIVRFDVDWSTAGPSPYYFSDIDVDGRSQKIVFNGDRTTYFIWPDESGETNSQPSWHGKLRAGGKGK